MRFGALGLCHRRTLEKEVIRLHVATDAGEHFEQGPTARATLRTPAVWLAKLGRGLAY